MHENKRVRRRLLKLRFLVRCALWSEKYGIRKQKNCKIPSNKVHHLFKLASVIAEQNLAEASMHSQIISAPNNFLDCWMLMVMFVNIFGRKGSTSVVHGQT